MKRAAIYSPYLDTLGGGERYMLSIARLLLEHGWNVEVESNDNQILGKAGKRFSMDLKSAKVVQSIKRGDGYDLCVWLSDGSVPTLSSRVNILHFQRPFFDVDGKSLLNRAKFFRIKRVVVNSEFTKQWIDREYPKESVVLYPPVDVKKFKQKKKEKSIIYVGRFSQLEQSKRQDILIEAFKKEFDRKGSFLKDWKLILMGGSDVGRTSWLDQLRQNAKGYPIKIIENPAFPEIVDYLSRASIFWSAAGFGMDQDKEPQKMEHFGITVVESMAAGCVPIIFNGGGYREIIEEGENGFLWSTQEEMLQKTELVIADKKISSILSKNAKESSLEFSYEKFVERFLKLL